MTIIANKDPLDGKRGKILVVDDNPLIRELLEFSLTSFGYSFASASDGIEAVEHLKKEEFSIVITDMIMPNMDGMQLLNYIREKYPKTGVIVITGYTGSFSYTDVIKAGANDFITKPFTADELEAKIDRLIRERHYIQELEHLSMCDALTDLYNRRYFDVKIKEEVHRAFRQNYPLSLSFIDVDKFKTYNDSFGHQAGDEVLQAISRLLLKCTRENVDWVFRYGGDEFAIITPYVTIEQTRPVVERILHSYRGHDFSPTTLSVGVAEFIRHKNLSWDEEIANLVRKADNALYRAKESGKDMVYFYIDPSK